jgi:hypothetical protein
VQPIGNGRRAFIRASFGAASNGFASLTDAQIAAWSAYADAHPITDSLGQSVKLTGHMMYVGVATQLQNIGQALPTDPPVTATVTPLSPVTLYVDATPTVLVYALTTDTMSTTLDALSKPVSAAVTFVKTFTQLGLLHGATFAQDITDAYLAQFGAPPLDSRVYARITPVNQYGVAGTPTILSTRTAAASALPVAVLTSATAATVTVTWTGGGSYYVSLFDPGAGLFINQGTSAGGPAVSPITVSGLTTGQKFFARLETGAGVWGGPSNTITIT